MCGENVFHYLNGVLGCETGQLSELNPSGVVVNND